LKFSKNTLQNDQLLQDLKREAWADDVIDALRRAKIATYKQLFGFIGDNTKDPQLRADICDEIRRLFIWIDRRRFVPPLLEALKTDYEPLLQNAIRALGNLESKRAVPFIVDLVKNKALSYETRYFAILALTEGIGDSRAISALQQVMFDLNDDLKVRADAIEHSAWFHNQSLVTIYAQLLADSEQEIRFWAAYGLAVIRVDISLALGELDRVAAFDHIAPDGWWHIDRESFKSLENIYWERLGLSDGKSSGESVYIISPMPEYTTFEWRFNRWPYGEYKKLAPPNLNVDSAWLAEKMQENWPSVKLNVREPKPLTYLVDWLVEIDGEPLIGGLHRDQYVIVMTGNKKAIRTFAAWYRSIIEPKQYLFLYEWSYLAVELRQGMSAADVEAEQVERSKHMSALEERAIDYPWVIETT
jgi:hypothetical protein